MFHSFIKCEQKKQRTSLQTGKTANLFANTKISEPVGQQKKQRTCRPTQKAANLHDDTKSNDPVCQRNILPTCAAISIDQKQYSTDKG
jgi:hypothetical protein